MTAPPRPCRTCKPRRAYPTRPDPREREHVAVAIERDRATSTIYSICNSDGKKEGPLGTRSHTACVKGCIIQTLIAPTPPRKPYVLCALAPASVGWRISVLDESKPPPTATESKLPDA